VDLKRCWFAVLFAFGNGGCSGFGKKGWLCRSDVGEEEVKRTELDLYVCSCQRIILS